AAGLDIVNDGEHSKSVYSGYLYPRLSGFTPDPSRSRERAPTRDALAFGPVYEDRRAMNRARPRKTSGGEARVQLVCTGPVKYVGHKHMLADIENLKAALRSAGSEEGFMTAVAPTHPANSNPNEHYRTHEEYQIALADALHEEYKTIVDSGLVLQVDDPLIANHWDHHPELSLEE